MCLDPPRSTPPSPEVRTERAIARQLSRTWFAFFENFGRLTTVQREAIPPIFLGGDLLVSAATASGKTEAACAPLVERYLGRPTPWTILYVSPTRALVNDLHARLFVPLSRLGLRVDRRTGEHRASIANLPHILLTTPESFDSMLCRGRRGDRGHGLDQVVAVVLDEIHLLYGTARGEQLRWLLERLRNLQQANTKGINRRKTFQTVALSATLPDHDAVLAAFMPNGLLIKVPGGREIETVAPSCDSASVEVALPAYLASCTLSEKVLVFANSRRRVDDLTATLRLIVSPLGYQVRAHHGSLAREEREATETAAQQERRLVLVATSTLEIGIDIGDVDLVILDGPPPDVSSLLQRIGRGNRRSGATRVMACASSPGEALIQAAQIEAARDGWLGPAECGPHYAVARQQLASLIFQGARVATPREQLQAFLDTCTDSRTARTLLAHLVETGEFEEDASGVRLGSAWLDLAGRGAIHSTIEDAPGATVHDELTGREIVSGISAHDGRGLRTGGQFLQVRRWDTFSIEVRQVTDLALADGDWRYATRPRFRSAGQPQAVQRYFGLPQGTWPRLQGADGDYVFHFGGDRRQAVLDLAMRQAGAATAGTIVTAWFLKIPKGGGQPHWLTQAGPARLELTLIEEVDRLEKLLGRPHANRGLPIDVRLEEVRGWLCLDAELAACQAAEWPIVTEPTLVSGLQLLLSSLL